MINLENEVIDPQTQIDTLLALADTGHIAFVPQFRGYEQDDSTSYNVKVNRVELAKDYPGEGVIFMQIVEAA